MSRRVHKYHIREGKALTVPVSATAKIVHFDRNQAAIRVWIEDVHDGYTNLDMEMEVYGTGETIHDDTLEHVRSITDGPWVWHLYAKKLVRR